MRRSISCVFHVNVTENEILLVVCAGFWRVIGNCEMGDCQLRKAYKIRLSYLVWYYCHYNYTF